jgi:hypothetical protein
MIRAGQAQQDKREVHRLRNQQADMLHRLRIACSQASDVLLLPIKVHGPDTMNPQLQDTIYAGLHHPEPMLKCWFSH